jgi:hypothetical protein
MYRELRRYDGVKEDEAVSEKLPGFWRKGSERATLAYFRE